MVTDYLAAAGLHDDLDAFGFDLVGYGCTTCIGNSGPLPDAVAEAVDEGGIVVGSVLSGNRNFEGRVHPQVKANYLASPPLVVAYALAGTLMRDLTTEPLGKGKDGEPVYLKDVWPDQAEVGGGGQECRRPPRCSRRATPTSSPATSTGPSIGGGDSGMTYDWDEGSTYVRLPPYFEGMPAAAPESVPDITEARVLAILGDSITTDHISPAGSIAQNSPAAEYLQSYQIQRKDFNSYGSRRGNHEVMMRGTFANIRLKNEMADGKEGGWTKLMPEGEVMSIYDAAMRYKERGTPLVVFAGKEYGTGSSRDWAAKGTNLLGVKAVIAESFERIHRSNLVGMGVLPLTFKDGETRSSLKLDGSEVITLEGLSGGLKPRMDVACTISRADGSRDQDLTALPARYRRRGRLLPPRRHPALRAALAPGAEPGCRQRLRSRRPDR